MKKYCYLLLIVFISCNSREVRIKKVVDGDSFYTSENIEIRIYGADAPENTRGHNQPFGIEATNFTRRLIEGKTVKLITKDHDKYHREVAKVILANGDDLSELLIKAGLAWASKRYSPKAYYNEEIEAKNKRVGLWVQDNPINPYNFRKQFKNK
jgi:micrococcal nuclease